MADINSDDFTKIVKDAFYISIGLGVIGFQKAQVRRQELMRSINGQVDEAKGRIENLGDADAMVADARTQIQKLIDGAEDRVKLVEERLNALEEQIDAHLDQIESKLPEQAADLMKQARDAAKDARSQVLSLVNRAA